MNLSAPPRPHPEWWDIVLPDRVLVWFGIACAVVGVGFRWHDRALFFQPNYPHAIYTHAAANVSREAQLSTIGDKYPCQGTHNGRSNVRGHSCRNRTFGTSVRADARTLVSEALHAGGLVSGRTLHPSPGGRVEREHRQRLLRRAPIHDPDVALGGWAVVPASCVAARAAISGVSCLAARR